MARPIGQESREFSIFLELNAAIFPDPKFPTRMSWLNAPNPLGALVTAHGRVQEFSLLESSQQHALGVEDIDKSLAIAGHFIVLG